MSFGLALLWLVGVVAVVLAAALVLPLSVKIEALADDELRIWADVQPFGRFGPMIRLRNLQGARGEVATQPAKPSARRPHNLHRLPKAGFRAAFDLISLIRIRSVSIDVRFGCSDPADTGEMFGLLSPLIYGVKQLPRMELQITPVFDDAILEGRATLELFVIPISLVPVAARFGWATLGPSR